MESIVATHPLELVHINYLCLESRRGKEENILVVTDHFTWYTQAYVTQSQMAQTMSKAYGTISSYIMDCWRKSFWIRRGALKE